MASRIASPSDSRGRGNCARLAYKTAREACPGSRPAGRPAGRPVGRPAGAGGAAVPHCRPCHWVQAARAHARRAAHAECARRVRCDQRAGPRGGYAATCQSAGALRARRACTAKRTGLVGCSHTASAHDFQALRAYAPHQSPSWGLRKGVSGRWVSHYSLHQRMGGGNTCAFEGQKYDSKMAEGPMPSSIPTMRLGDTKAAAGAPDAGGGSRKVCTRY